MLVITSISTVIILHESELGFMRLEEIKNKGFGFEIEVERRKEGGSEREKAREIFKKGGNFLFPLRKI